MPDGMRRLILFMVLSLDGFVGGPNGEMDWENRDPQVGMEMSTPLINTIDTILIGRVLYKGFEQAWPAMATNPTSPKELVDFANWIENSQKVVFSNTLKAVLWKNARIVPATSDDDIVKEVTRLKQGEGKDMVVFGGARLAQTLSRLGLIDEYRFKLQQVALGSGLQLFKGKTNLKLVKSKEFKSGVIGLYYQPVR